MGRIRSTDTHDFHGVQCAACSKKETIKVPCGRIGSDKRFTKYHEYLCRSCWKQNDANKGMYVAPTSGKNWQQADAPKRPSIKEQLK
jgi:DNA-directed RNA polymerase subunit RPC12/RpoP